MEVKPPLPPFTKQDALNKVKMAEDAWNSADPERVSQVYSQNTQWRNRAEFPQGREQVKQFLTKKWAKERQYRLIKELWLFSDHKIAVRFAYEWLDSPAEQWFRSYGNENWQFNAQGLMTHRFASINDLAISETERKFHWPLGVRPANSASLSDLGL